MAGQEVGSGTTATLSCKITGVTEALTVTWLNDKEEVIDTGDGFTVDQGKKALTFSTKEFSIQTRFCKMKFGKVTVFNILSIIGEAVITLFAISQPIKTQDRLLNKETKK